MQRHGRGRTRRNDGRRHERGAVAVEFALVLIPLLTLMLGSIQFGWYFFTAQSASSAARETARRLTVGDCQAPADAALKYARRQANLSGLNLTFGEALPGSDDGFVAGTQGTLPPQGAQLRVVVTADGHIIGFLPMPDAGQVKRVTDSRVEDRTEESC